MTPIYTYFEPDPQLPTSQWRELLQLWANSWKAQGWEPVILTRADAQKSPYYQKLRAKAATFPTVNPKGYELECFLRWAAAHAVGGGVFSDSDVINNGLRPFAPGGEILLHETGCPSLLSGDRYAMEELIKRFLTYTVTDSDTYGGKPHTSDMLILRKFQDECTNLCMSFGMRGWQKSPAIHFSTDSILRFFGKTPNKAHVVGEFFPALLAAPAS